MTDINIDYANNPIDILNPVKPKPKVKNTEKKLTPRGGGAIRKYESSNGDITKNFLGISASNLHADVKDAENYLAIYAEALSKNPNDKNLKQQFDDSYNHFIKLANEYADLTNEVYQTSKVKQEVLSGVEERVRSGDTSPEAQAKRDAIANIPTLTPEDPLSTRRYVNAFQPFTGEDYAFEYFKPGSPEGVGTAISLLPDKSGLFYQKDDGAPESLENAVFRTVAELQSSGKVNEFRNLLISSGFVKGKDAIAMLSGANNTFGSGIVDQTTRDYLRAAVKFTTILNMSTINDGKMGAKKFIGLDQFLKNYKGQFNFALGNGNSSGGSSGTPNYQKNISSQKFDTGDFEVDLDSVFQKYTGQGATEEDIKWFTNKMNAVNPQVTISKTSGDVTRTTTSGGITAGDKELMMREQALNDPNAENYNKATKFLDYFRKALESPIQLG